MSTYSFPKKERLLKQRDFQEVLRKGKRYHSKNFTVIVKHLEGEHRRIGIITGKKVGNAIRRNRFKRIIREFYRLNKDLFPPSSDIIVIVKPSNTTLSFRDIEEELKSVLHTYILAGSEIND